jgi:hypothetical protein
VYLIFICSCSYGPDLGSGSSPGSGSGSGPSIGWGSDSGCSCWAWGIRDASVAGQGYGPPTPLVPVRRPRIGCWTRAFPHYAHVVADHDRWAPKYVNWCCVIVCTFIYPFVVTNKLHYLFQATSCRTPACSTNSPGGQPARRDSVEGSHDTLLVRLLPPQRASRPLEAGDPHVPLHRRRDDGDPSRHVTTNGPSLWGWAAEDHRHLR